MRPATPEIVRGLLITFTSNVQPELPTVWAQAQLRTSLMLLDTVAQEWDSAADVLVRENEALQRFCWLAADAVTRYGVAPLQSLHESLLVAAALAAAVDLRLTTLTERNTVLWQAVEPVIELLAGDDGIAVWAAELREQAQPLLRAHVETRTARRPGV